MAWDPFEEATGLMRQGFSAPVRCFKAGMDRLPGVLISSLGDAKPRNACQVRL